MKIENPTPEDIRSFYYRNRKYFEQLSSYYSIHDPDFYEREFLKYELKGYRLRRKWFGIVKYSSLTIILAGAILFYVCEFHFRIGFTDYYVKKNSFSIATLELPDFLKGMDLFSKGQYSMAKEYFLKVDRNDDSFDEAERMIKLCDENIDKEGITNQSDSGKKPSK